MEWNDSAIVLQVGRFREADMWLRILSRKRGLLTVFAFGGSRSRQRFCGCLDVLNTLTCRVKSSRNGQFLSLEEGILLRGPQVLREDWSRLGMLMNCIRFVEVLGISQDASKKVYDLMQDMFTYFEKLKTPHMLYPILFRLRMACEQGFTPSWHICATCGKVLNEKDVMFQLDEGITHCLNCRRNSSPYTLRLPTQSLKALHRVEQDSPLEWNVQDLNFEERQACLKTVDGFVQYHLGIAWS